MPRFRSLCAAAVLAFALVLALALAPMASAAPAVQIDGSWWSTLAAGFDGILDRLGLGDTGIVTVRAPEGPGLEPDGSSQQILGGVPGSGGADEGDRTIPPQDDQGDW